MDQGPDERGGRRMTATLARTMSRAELLALPVTIEVPTAGRAFGFSRAHSYELARVGEFPVRVMKVGRARYRVITAELLEALGIDPEARQ